MNMTNQLLLICYALFTIKLIHTYKTCFEESNHINYLFLNSMSQMKIPLIPSDCLLCQSAYQVSVMDNKTETFEHFRLIYNLLTNNYLVIEQFNG